MKIQHMNRQTLIIHPEDRSTEFLRRIYADIPDATVVTGGVTREKLKELIRTHDRVMMMGHGSENGLLSVGNFPGSGMYAVDEDFAKLLRSKTDSVFIWCYAMSFIIKHRLQGFACDMFISENMEARMRRVSSTSEEVEESNHAFGRIVGMNIHKESIPLYESVTEAYGELAKTNRIAAYNLKRLYAYTSAGFHMRA
jgi:hypothetical protein